MYKYMLYAIPFDNFKKYFRTVKRKNKLSREKQERLSEKFADEIAWRSGFNIPIYGCVEIGEE